MAYPDRPRSTSKRALAGVAAGLVMAAGSLALPAQAAGTTTSANPYGPRLVICHYLPWMC